MVAGKKGSETPSRMGRHELLFRIASGGMAEVYAARSTGAGGFEKLVAIKRMLPTLADDEDFVAMFLDEARMAATIQSPHVVQTLDLGRDETGALYLVMDLVVGAPLSRIMKEAARARRVVPLGMAVELISQAAEGLHAAHEATTASGDPLHIVHRDVSPQNILIGVDGRARITDFGVARAVSRLTKTAAGRVKGKFAYSSPEQLRSNDLDRRADVFALGVVAWELLAGQRLFVAEHPLAVIERVQSMPIVDISTVRPKVPPPISEVVMTALQRDPEQRWQTAHEFAEELREEAVASGIPLPNGTEIGRFVQAAGGESLKKFRSNIRQALSATPVEEESTGAVDFASVSEAEDDPSEVTDDVGVPRTTSKSLDESSVARMPGEVLVSPKAATRPVNWRPVIAGAVGVLLLFGAGAIGYSLAHRASPRSARRSSRDHANDLGRRSDERHRLGNRDGRGADDDRRDRRDSRRGRRRGSRRGEPSPAPTRAPPRDPRGADRRESGRDDAHQHDARGDGEPDGPSIRDEPRAYASERPERTSSGQLHAHGARPVRSVRPGERTGPKLREAGAILPPASG